MQNKFVTGCMGCNRGIRRNCIPAVVFNFYAQQFNLIPDSVFLLP